MITTSQPLPRSAHRQGRILRLVLALLLLFVVLLPIAVHFYNRHHAEHSLAAAIAETDRLDPGWRLEQIEKQRLALPDERNAAIPVGKAALLLPEKGWESKALKDVVFWNSSPLFWPCPVNELTAVLVEPLCEAVKPHLSVIAMAEMALPLDEGCFHVNWETDNELRHIGRLKILGDYIACRAMLQSHDGDHEGACKSGLTILAVARSIGKEPSSLSQFYRAWLSSQAVATFQRALAQGKVSEAALAEAQKRLAQEADEPVLYYAMRGQRCEITRLYTDLEAGTVEKHYSHFLPENKPFRERIDFFMNGNTLKSEFAWCLNLLNEAIVASRLPRKIQANAFKSLQTNANAAPQPLWADHCFGYPLLPIDFHLRVIVNLDCAVAGIAVERFRLQCGRWPETLEEVVAAKLLKSVPIDLSDGNPLRLRKTENGIVVYSIGPAGSFDGSASEPNLAYEGKAIYYEFRLWDESHRRQPPRPLPEKAEKKDDEKR